jgi:hypothetical protein
VPSVKREPALQAVSIVLVGSFNPKILHPEWFRTNDLLRVEEVESADVEIVHRDVASFRADWLRLQVTADRFVASTDNPTTYEPLRDLVINVFKILEHTPVEQMGINHQQHFQLASQAECDRIGHLLSPKDRWASFMTTPLLSSMTISGQPEPESTAVSLVTIEPSTRAKPGVFLRTNRHYAKAMHPNGHDLFENLENDWDKASAFAKKAAKELIDAILDGGSSQ